MFSVKYNCPFVLTRGSRIGQNCDRINCKSPNHILEKLKQTQEKEREQEKRLHVTHPCRKQDVNGIVCGRLDCLEHIRISDFLNLPDVFFEIEESNYDFSYSLRLIEMYNFSTQNTSDKEYKNEFVIFIQNHLNMITHKTDKRVKCLYIVYLYHLFDTPNVKFFIKKYSYFNESIGRLLYELKEDNMHDPSVSFFVSYMESTFTSDINKKYLRKIKNNTRRGWFLIRVLVKLSILYRTSLMYTYRPGGPAYLEAEARFYKLAGLQKLVRETNDYTKLFIENIGC